MTVYVKPMSCDVYSPAVVNPETFARACRNLTVFMYRKARALSEVIGISYVDAVSAPESKREIIETFKDCMTNKKPFPVFNGGCDTAIYGAGGNYAFRFWHDWLHCRENLGVGLQDELTIGWLHTLEVAKVFGNNSLEARVMMADTIGQSLYYAKHRAFVEDQKAFVYRMVDDGAWLAELIGVPVVNIGL